MKKMICQFCGLEIRVRKTCPHCARPCNFINVILAEEQEEKDELEKRYQEALKIATTQKTFSPLKDYEKEVATKSRAAIGRSVSELKALANSENALYATYYQKIKAPIRLPDDDKYHLLRTLTDIILFDDEKDEIRFAALTLNGDGLKNYGNAFFFCKEDMISHRTSVFEENSVMFMKHHHIEVYNAPDMPPGYKATWEDRGKLAAAKCVSGLKPSPGINDFENLLLKPGATSEEDEFIEVHIYGSMTMHTFEHVNVLSTLGRDDKILMKGVESKLSKIGVTVEYI